MCDSSCRVLNMEEAYLTMLETGELPDRVFEDWLWRSDPEETYSKDVLMNRNQLLGFLVCLCKGVQLQSGAHADDPPGRLRLMDKPVGSMSLRELKDTMENLQIEWPVFLERLGINPNAQANLDAVISMLDQCAARFGELCASAYDESVLDDLGSTEPHQGTGLLKITLACIRRTVSAFMVFYRHLHLLAVSQVLPAEWVDHQISKYHLEASGDEFNHLCMHIGLPVAAKLCYKHDFPGMYNHVSQVAFFHNSEYRRTPRLPLDELKGASVEQVLPALLQIYPGIGVKYEEDAIDLTTPGKDWFWLVLPRRVYLVDPERKVWYSSEITKLLQVYVADLHLN
jgi:hypothetical protein